MKVIDSYLMTAVAVRFSLVLFGFVGMFSFFELIAELGQVGASGYQLRDAFVYVLFRLPSVCYELTPLSALIGGLWAMADLAASSELTVARASGYRPSDAVAGMLITALPLVLGVLLLSEVLMPWSDPKANSTRANSGSGLSTQSLKTGYWVKDNLVAAESLVTERFINFRQSLPSGSARVIKVYEFDSGHRMVRLVEAEEGSVQPIQADEASVKSLWRLRNARVLEIRPDGSAEASIKETFAFESAVLAETLEALLVRPEQMAAHQLWRYLSYLTEARQKTNRYELALWKRLTYPLGVIAMLLLALPLAYVHTRSGYLGLKMFVGIAVGIVFYIFNNLFAHLTILGDWPAAAVAVTPSLIALLLALSVLQIAQRRAL